MSGESEGGYGAGIEGIADGVVRVGGDDVAVVFVEEDVVGFEAGFPFVMAVVNGDGGVEVSFFEIVVLVDDDGPGVGIGVEVVGVVADHAAGVDENVGREDVLVGDAAHGFEIRGGLELRAACRAEARAVRREWILAAGLAALARWEFRSALVRDGR